MLLFKILNTLIFVLLLFAFRIMAKRHVSFGNLNLTLVIK